MATPMEKACKEFHKDADLGEESGYLPITITPFALSNIKEKDKATLLQAIRSVNPETMLILLLGEANQIIHGSKNVSITNKLLDDYHKLFETPFVREFEGPKSILAIDPGHKLEGGLNIQKYDIDERLKAYNVVSILLVKSEFPLTPVFGPHKEFKFPSPVDTFTRNGKPTDEKPQKNGSVRYYRNFLFPEELNAIRKSLRRDNQPQVFHNIIKESKTFELPLRRRVYSKGMDVLEELVTYPGPLVISSRIKDTCYRSFKYLVDRRALFSRPTKAFYGQTGYPDVQECVSAENYSLYPHPFERCREWSTAEDKINSYLDRYYFSRFMPSTAKSKSKTKLSPFIRRMNDWANTELERQILALQRAPPPLGGKRKTRKRRKH